MMTLTADLFAGGIVTRNGPKRALRFAALGLKSCALRCATGIAGVIHARCWKARTSCGSRISICTTFAPYWRGRNAGLAEALTRRI